MLVYTSMGNTLELIEPSIKQGGEGAIYRIKNYPNRVAKVYSDSDDARKRENKLAAQVSVYGSINSATGGVTAWPMGMLYNNKREFIGFGMPCITAQQELDDLYAYPPKKFSLNLKEKITCLVNLCESVKRIHDLGQCIGDMNPNNMKIDEKNLKVYLVDCDSYNFNNGNQTFRCLVCAPGYVAPEIIKACKGYTYEDCPNTTFTENSDNFALAIHIFRMLFNGAHPYARRQSISNNVTKSNLGSVSSLPVPNCDRSVEKGESLYFQKITGYDIPLWSPDITSIPEYLRSLFERAFIKGYLNPNARPKPEEWIAALKMYANDLSYCGQDYYWKGNKGSCPYCEARKRFLGYIPTQKAQQQITASMVPVTTYNYVSPMKAPAYSPSYTTYNHVQTPVDRAGRTKAITSLVLGILALNGLPYGVGVLVGGAGLIFNLLARKTNYRGKALSAGLVVSILGIIYGVFLGAITIYSLIQYQN